MTVEVTVEPTRSENSVIFRLNRTLHPPGTGLSFPDAHTAQVNPIATALFKIKGVASVWIIGSEVQVSKEENFRWSTIHSKIVETLRRTVA